MTNTKNIATLIFRILGTLLIIDGSMAVLAWLIDLLSKALGKGAVIDTPNSDGIGMFIIGWCMCHFSKKLAVLFCKGLDDDSK